MSSVSTSAASPSAGPPSEIHGLSYPQSFLDDECPVLLDRPAPHTPIRTISAKSFAAIHLEHLTAHVPDCVIFPFLHGLEGDNDAQNRFFGAAAAPPRAPKFRGLVWVAADEPLGSGSGSPISEHDHSDVDSDEHLSDDEGRSHSHEDAFGLAMDIDEDVTASTSEDPNDAVHMHPVQQRMYGFNRDTKVNTHDRRASDAASSVVSSVPSVFSSRGRSFSTTSTAPTQASPPTSPKSPSQSISSGLGPLLEPSSSSPTRIPPPRLPHFTSTFRPYELLRTDATGNIHPEFIEPKIPNGISLRNFGIQVVRTFIIFDSPSALPPSPPL
jgi:dual specificity MAP kinase phosphatase